MKKVESSLDHLRKLFIMPDSTDKFMEFGHDVLEMIHEFFQEKKGLHKRIALPELAQIFDQISIPKDPQLIRDVLQEIKDKVTVHSVKVGSPHYIGHMTSAIPYFMVFLEIIITALNQNQVKIETAKASSFVERELIAWMHRIIFNRDDTFYRKNIQNPRIALGNITSGGTISNLTALMIARERAFPADRNFPGIRKVGVEGALNYYGYSKMVIFVSRRGHYSIRKAANLLGLGEKNVIYIPVDTYHRINIKALRKTIQNIKRIDLEKGEKTKIMSIIGIAGTTETGNIDNLMELGNIAREENAYFHVDAAWGGAALLVDEYKSLFRGIEKADSVAVDAHKLLYCPMSMGVVAFRNEKDLNHLKTISQYVNRPDSVDTGRFTIEGSRPFACLKLWASLKIIGRDGYRLLFGQAQEATSTFKRILEESGNFEILNHPELFILNYRLVPKKIMEKLNGWAERKKTLSNNNDKKNLTKKIQKVNSVLNNLNILLQKSIRQDDTTFVSRTILESTRYRPQRIVVLRAVLINPLINNDILKKIVSTQNNIALRLIDQFEPIIKEAIA